MNAGWSSSTGVQIAMTRFSQVTYDDVTQTAEVGAGLVWDDVYAVLEPYNVNVVGGRVPGIGVAGFTLGGGKLRLSMSHRFPMVIKRYNLTGYSWKTNQYGLTLDTVQAFELVLPNGTVTSITSPSHSDLFFGLKVGRLNIRGCLLGNQHFL